VWPKQNITPRLRLIRSQAAKRRWRKWTPEERSAYCSEMARAGWEDRTPEERKEHGRKLAEGRRRAQEARKMANVTQELSNCRLLYDLTNHSITVYADDGTIALKIWSLPDTPGGFDLIKGEGHAIEIHNPNGVDFIPMPDNYEDSKKAGYE
jgi:hypothetical protein